MKLFNIKTIFAFVAACAAFGFAACSDDDGIDNRELDYGYVQFKLYKEGLQPQRSKTLSRADDSTVEQLDSLADACKLQVNLKAGATTISQTLLLSAANDESAEYGLRSDKLQLMTGEYQIISFMLYDINDKPLYSGTVAADNNMLSVVAGGLTLHDLTANVAPRGKVRFNLIKDFSDFEGWKNDSNSRSYKTEREYTFDEIAYFDVTIHKVNSDEPSITYRKLKSNFSIHFDEEDPESPFGYQTSSITCDSLLILPAGTYEITGYVTYDTNEALLETVIDEQFPKNNFTIEDNQTTDAKVPVKLYEADEYMKDNYALRTIWEELDGKNWYYGGQDYAKGCNWDFNKAPDLWSDQPGVEVHSNGRVAKLVLSEFGIKGPMPDALGQLTELVELYLGTHNDTNTGTYDPMLDQSKSLEDRNRNRMAYNKQYLASIHILPQMSYPCALALKEHNLSSPAMALYEQGYSEEQIFDRKTGKQLEIAPKDVIAGRFCNGLESLPESLGNLTKLEYLYIGNSPIKTLPATIGNLTSCTLLEIYNCPNLKVPDEIGDMPALVQVNISCNMGTETIPGWDNDNLQRIINELATGSSQNTIQMLYCRDNNLESVPASIAGMKRLGLLDLSNNKIKGVVNAMGNDFAPSEIYFDNNQITGFGVDEGNGRRLFCNIDNLETFSASYNQLTEVPDIFDSQSPYYLSSANFAYNQIERVQNANETGTKAYQGINVTTFTLSGNRIKAYPACFAKSNSQISYILLAGNGMETFEEGCFTSPKPSTMANLISIDLTYNRLTKFPEDFHAVSLAYLYGVDISYNAFSSFPWEPTDARGLTVYGVRGQRDNSGARCLKEWPIGIYKHTGLRGLFLGSNDLRKVDDTISSLIYNLDISDNPNITFDASDICYYWQAGAYNLIYDKTQNITNCPEMLE